MSWTVKINGEGQRVRLAGAPPDIPPIRSSFRAIATPDEGERRPGMEIYWEVIDGVPRCREVRFIRSPHGREVLRSDFEGLHLETWLEDVTTAMLRQPKWSQGSDGSWSYTHDDSRNTELRRLVRGARRAASNRGPNDDQLQAAAATYISADRAPTQAVAEQFGIAHRTASLWIKRAREKGYLS